jgi:hypothetical protein
MHNRCEVAHALWEYSFHLQEPLRIIQCLYTALDFVVLPSLEVCIRMKLAELLILHCTIATSKEAALMHLERAFSLHSEINDKKFHILNAICNIHLQETKDLNAFHAFAHQACTLARKSNSFQWLLFWQRQILDVLFDEGNQNRLEAFKFLNSALEEHLAAGRQSDYQTLMLYKCSRIISFGKIKSVKEILNQLTNQTEWSKAIHCAVNLLEGDLQSLKQLLVGIPAANKKICIGSEEDSNTSQKDIHLNSIQKDSDCVVDQKGSNNENHQSSPSSHINSTPRDSIPTDCSYSLIFCLFQAIVAAYEYQSQLSSIKEIRESIREAYFASTTQEISIFQSNKITEFLFSLWLNASLLTESAQIPLLLQHSLEKHQRKHLDCILAKLGLIMRSNDQMEESKMWLQIASKKTCYPSQAALFSLLLQWSTNESQPLPSIECFPALLPVKLLLEGVQFLQKGQIQLHKAKYKFFEALKHANNKNCNNVHVKIIALTLLAHSYLGTDLEQAKKVVVAALQLVREQGGELKALLVKIAKRANINGN